MSFKYKPRRVTLSYEKIVSVNISLQTTAVTTASFGTPMFVGANVWFTERSRTYIDSTSAAVDLPTDSDEYKGLVQAFSQDVPPAQVKVGRREADNITFTPSAATAIGQEYTVTVVGTDSVAIVASFITSTGSETAANITAALDTALSGIVGVTVVDGTGTLVLSRTGTDDYSVNSIERMTYAITTTETAPTMMAAITAEDDDFYFVATNDHTSTFVLALAADIEARTKLYFVSVQEVAALTAYVDTNTDIMSLLRQNSYFRTSAWYYHTADTTFPEMGYIAVAAPADSGKKIWANNRIFGSGAARNATTNLLLSVTEKGNLGDRYANYTEEVGGIAITRRGMVSGKEWIDTIRNRDFLEARITEAYQNFLINSPVVPYTDAGITKVGNVLTSTLDRYVETEAQPHILQQNNPYVLAFPRRSDVSFSDVADRIFNGAFTAYLSGAIQVVKIQGTLTYEAAS